MMVDSVPLWFAVLIAVWALSMWAWLFRREIAVWLGLMEDDG